MNQNDAGSVQISAATSHERSSARVVVPITIGVGVLALACNLPFQAQPGYEVLTCPNSAVDTQSINVDANASKDDLMRIAEYNLAMKDAGITIDETSTIVLRMNGVDKDNNGNFIEMAISRSPIGGSFELGSQAIVSFKDKKDNVESFSFNIDDEDNLVVRPIESNGITKVFFNGRSLKGATRLTKFMELSIKGLVTQEQVEDMLARGDYSEITSLVLSNPLVKTCCVIADDPIGIRRAFESLHELASLETDAGPLPPIGGNPPGTVVSPATPTLVAPTVEPVATPTEMSTLTPTATEIPGLTSADLNTDWQNMERVKANLKDGDFFNSADYNNQILKLYLKGETRQIPADAPAINWIYSFNEKMAKDRGFASRLQVKLGPNKEISKRGMVMVDAGVVDIMNELYRFATFIIKNIDGTFGVVKYVIPEQAFINNPDRDWSWFYGENPDRMVVPQLPLDPASCPAGFGQGYCDMLVRVGMDNVDAQIQQWADKDIVPSDLIVPLIASNVHATQE
ncbi:MAG: hypothetical protein US40_C0009G0015 [Candidatus Roizmanbacteria bacterium GW2011_GWC2_37_13]|uniref:Uncharacterized protein n=1 Tax=Candidatus Roizmanbacteria bacterium GW2011_GWC2_37_13 TaxID=1618486 RepID=A0A0G0IM67_9BACT|nr:MAG: hypothetical protein US38_C0009G0018 [Candidatus Roizmanbacteria bacterium GW2011_GWC1_37_12]KKQ25309.1 MAG: hypothetical protein US40_C0009G0015 [Candidatus Roizmanbacteria bacterium GW2011_GWC2_37_13]